MGGNKLTKKGVCILLTLVLMFGMIGGANSAAGIQSTLPTSSTEAEIEEIRMFDNLDNFVGFNSTGYGETIDPEVDDWEPYSLPYYVSCSQIDGGYHAGAGARSGVVTIVYRGNGHTGGTVPNQQAVNTPGSVQLAGQGNLSRIGFVFHGWSHVGGARYAASATRSWPTAVTGQYTLDAYWLRSQVRIIYQGNGHTGGLVPADQVVPAPGSAYLRGPGNMTRAGHTFAGWQHINGGAIMPANHRVSFTAAQNSQLTLRAVWTPNANVPISAPGQPWVSDITQTAVTISWNAVSGATSYRLYRNGGLVTTVTGTSFRVTGLTANSEHTFEVRAVNASGGTSALSPGRFVRTLAAVPVAPGRPTVSNITQTSATISWNAVTGATSYLLYRDDEPFNTVGGTTFTDRSLTPNTTYTFAVRANGVSGRSGLSPTLSFTTLPANRVVPNVTLNNISNITLGQTVTVSGSATQSVGTTWRMAARVTGPGIPAAGQWLGNVYAANYSRQFTPPQTGTYTVRLYARSFPEADARSDQGFAERTFTVSAAARVATSVVFMQAPGSAQAPTTGNTTVSFAAAVRDQHNATMNGHNPTFHITAMPPGTPSGSITISGNTVTIRHDALAGNVTIQARYGNLTANATLTLTRPAVPQFTVSPRGLFTIVETVGGVMGTATRVLTDTIAMPRNTSIVAASLGPQAPGDLRFGWRFETPGTNNTMVTQSTANFNVSGANREILIPAPPNPGRYRLVIRIYDSGNNFIRSEVFTAFVTHGPVDASVVPFLRDGFNVRWLNRGLSGQGMTARQTFSALNTAVFDVANTYNARNSLIEDEDNIYYFRLGRFMGSTNCNDVSWALSRIARALGVSVPIPPTATIRTRTPLEEGTWGTRVNGNRFMMRPDLRAFTGTFRNTHLISESENNGIHGRPEVGAWFFTEHIVARHGGAYFDPMFDIEANSILGLLYASLLRDNGSHNGIPTYKVDPFVVDIPMDLRIAIDAETGNYFYVPIHFASARAAGETRILVTGTPVLTRADMSASSALQYDYWMSVTYVQADLDAGIQPMSNGGISGLKVTFQPNPSPNIRMGTITLNKENGPHTIHVRQDGANSWMEVSEASLSVDAQGGTGTITVNSNINWVALSDADWLDLDLTLGVGNEELPFVIAANYTGQTRSTTIRIFGEGVARTITVTQNAGAFTTTITLNFYGRSNAPVVMPIQIGQPLCPVAVANVTRQVVGDGSHDNNDGWAFWGWFTDEQLNSSRRTRNGYRRPTVGASGFDLNTVITGALINSLANNENIDLYAVWVQWGDVNDNGLLNGIDVSLVSQYVRRFPGISIVRPALYVSRNTMVTGLDVSLISQNVRRFPGIVLGRAPSATPMAAMFDARGEDHQIWSVSHEIGSRGGYVDVRLKMDQITSYGMCWTMFTLNFDTSVLSNPRLSPRIDRNALPPDLQEAYDTLPPSLFGTVLGSFRGGNASLHNMIFEGVISWQPGEAIVSWQSNPNPAIPGNFSSGIFVDIRFDILENAPVGESLVTISKQPGDVFLGGVGALALPIAWDQFADGSVTVSP